MTREQYKEKVLNRNGNTWKTVYAEARTSTVHVFNMLRHFNILTTSGEEYNKWLDKYVEEYIIQNYVEGITEEELNSNMLAIFGALL